MTLNTRMTATTAVACVLVSTVLLPLFSDILGIDHLRPAVGLIRTARHCIAAGSP